MTCQALLVGGIPTPLQNMKVNGKDDNPYIMGKNVPNYQPDYQCCDSLNLL